MKQKQYTVHVTGMRYGTYKVTAKGAREAGDIAKKQFEVEYGDYWDYVKP